ncbi:DUF3139 domain-containing protein [Saccharibacillus sp. JS10]|uniref:DUF3139 domain-containing protein n=1 Tax=Saccharibacillus sp. JS10 TaxID=2950552 RepID=UPI00210CD806|nr:DUF3139 domain-containing protein [Saccharibacillus sp. JS10]MCQ4085830.1 DUF3139 domain-containing protein [Saccharibacillus sp. JS10]
MRKKKFWLTTLVILIAIAGSVFLFFQYRFNSLEKQLKEYLIVEEGYKESDILNVKAKLSVLPKYPVYVTFADDPSTQFIFTNRDIGLYKWYQLDPKLPRKLKKTEEAE